MTEPTTSVSAIKTPKQVFDDSEDGLAVWFAESTDDLCYVADRNRWYHWTGKVWEEDKTVSVYERIRGIVRGAAKDYSDGKHNILKKASTVAAIEKLARSDFKLVRLIEYFDADPWLLNTETGVADLKSGEIAKHKITDLFTKITRTTVGGECPRWMSFLDEVTNNDAELSAFLQRVAGYCLTGSVREHALFFFYGTGRNGKGVFLNTLSALLGEYAATASMDVLTESKGDRHPTELAALHGKRLVVAQEVDEGKNWAEAKLKTLTGGDKITARYMRGDFFTFEPQFKLIIAANHKPLLRNVDEAIRARLHLVPFTVTIPKEKRDIKLEEKLKEEWPGILQWALDGLAQYQRDGLNPPDAVQDATSDYFSDQDILSQWLDDCCEVGPDFWEIPSRLFKNWQNYAHAANLIPGTQPAFKEKLIAAGFRWSRTYQRGRHHVGLRLKPAPVEGWENQY